MDRGMMADGCPWGVPYRNWSYVELKRALTHFEEDKEEASFFPASIKAIRAELRSRKNRERTST